MYANNQSGLDVAWASTELCKNFDKTENADRKKK